MRWLFLGVLAALVSLILSIGWMNDNDPFPQAQQTPAGQDPLGAPPTQPARP